MPAKAEQKLFGSASKSNTTGTITGGAATATFAAVAATKHYIQRAIITGQAIAATVRATLTWTYNGSVQTAGFQLPVGTVQIILDFAGNPVESDSNTAVTLTIPSPGAGTVEATLIGFSTKD